MDEESQEQRDARVRSLWEKLDTKKEGLLDLPALKRGLKTLDHRRFSLSPLNILARLSHTDFFQALQNADDLIADVLHAADINHDGRIAFDG